MGIGPLLAIPPESGLLRSVPLPENAVYDLPSQVNVVIILLFRVNKQLGT
jgi:hypothetical protein